MRDEKRSEAERRKCELAEAEAAFRKRAMSKLRAGVRTYLFASAAASAMLEAQEAAPVFRLATNPSNDNDDYCF